MSTDAVRLALVGGGRMGRTHLDALASSEAVEVTAAMDPVPGAREALAARGLATHASLDELMAAGVPILCEKPLGVSAATAAGAGEAARDAGVLLQVGYWRRFVPEFVALR